MRREDFLSHSTSASRGDAIPIKRVLTLNVINTYTDCEGRYIILNTNIDGTTLDTVNVYGNNLSTELLFSSICNHICNHDREAIVWGGDFNFVMNLELDKVGGISKTNFRVRSIVLQIMHTLDLIDTWGERNPRSKGFTWFSNVDSFMQCRLDFFIISHHLKYCAMDCLITRMFGSDHSCVTLTV